MKEEKVFPIITKDQHEIKPYEKNGSIKKLPPVISDLLIAKCPIACNNCKTIYSNKLTGLQIVCKCPCHHHEQKTGGNQTDKIIRYC